jgi:hypothetical protein
MKFDRRPWWVRAACWLRGHRRMKGYAYCLRCETDFAKKVATRLGVMR